MIRRCIWAFTLVCCVGLFVCPGPAVAESQRPQEKVAVGPACLYESKAYSDGAFICVQKSLMLNCSSDGTRATWKVVADSDLNERCVSPIALSYPPAVENIGLKQLSTPSIERIPASTIPRLERWRHFRLWRHIADAPNAPIDIRCATWRHSYCRLSV